RDGYSRLQRAHEGNGHRRLPVGHSQTPEKYQTGDSRMPDVSAAEKKRRSAQPGGENRGRNHKAGRSNPEFIAAGYAGYARRGQSLYRRLRGIHVWRTARTKRNRAYAEIHSESGRENQSHPDHAAEKGAFSGAVRR